MKVVIDARMYGPERWTGIGRYLQNLLAQLEQLDHATEFVVLLGPDNFELYQPTSPNFSKVLAPWAPYSVGEQIGLARLLWKLRPDLVHFASPNAPLLYFGKRVTTVHDLTLLFYDTSRYSGLRGRVSQLKRLVFRLVLWYGIKVSRAVMTPTQYVKKQLMDRYHVSDQKVVATVLSVDSTMAPPEPIDRFALQDGYVLYVGNCYPYKNVGQLVEAFQLLPPEWVNLQLVLVGRDDTFRDRLKAQVAELGLGNRVVFTGQVSDGELVSLYQHAGLYAYPSLSEGFGLQGLEAMVHGVPVLAANASCLPETCGDAAAYFEPGSAVDLARMINELLSNQQRRLELRQAGLSRVTQFSWRRTAEQTQDAYLQGMR
jgi:glycosyltransferase involved in cell wall biosynthesis